jgi:hypothetical protein
MVFGSSPGQVFHHHRFNLFILQEISGHVKTTRDASFRDYSFFQKWAGGRQRGSAAGRNRLNGLDEAKDAIRQALQR